jgi:hypothetical protein
MALNPPFVLFCRRWRHRANGYRGPGFERTFDKFFALWVVFNALYTEVARREGRFGAGDDTACQEVLLQHLGARAFVGAINADPGVLAALDQVVVFMRNHDFYFKLDRRTGARQPVVDDDLRARIQSRGFNVRGQAILETLYAVRCNLFHGHKEFLARQGDLLRPMTVILTKVIDITYAHLDQ